MSAAFIVAIALAVLGVVLWIASYVLFLRANFDKAGWFVTGLLGWVAFAAAAVAVVVGIVQLIVGTLS